MKQFEVGDLVARVSDDDPNRVVYFGYIQENRPSLDGYLTVKCIEGPAYPPVGQLRHATEAEYLQWLLQGGSVDAF